MVLVAVHPVQVVLVEFLQRFSFQLHGRRSETSVLKIVIIGIPKQPRNPHRSPLNLSESYCSWNLELLQPAALRMVDNLEEIAIQSYNE